MKLLFDENLAPRLASALSDIYPGSLHIADCGLRGASDIVVWQYAQEKGFAIVSKDSDFVLRNLAPRIHAFLAGGEESCLVLSHPGDGKGSR